MQTARMQADGDDLALALQMADRADGLTLADFTGRAVGFTAKHDGSPVTETDLAVEAALLDLAARARPDDGFLGEETGKSNEGPRMWIVDPIDGTRSFAAGGRAWGTLIALSDHGRLAVGVVSAPALGGRWWAAEGSGAWAQRKGQAPSAAAVTSAADLGTARWVCHPTLESIGPEDL
jgi:histidinol-phosphatase